MMWPNVMLIIASLCLCRYSSSDPFTISSVIMYIGSPRVHTPINCTSFRCRRLCMIFASSRNASADIVPGFSVLTATSRIRRHFPTNYISMSAHVNYLPTVSQHICATHLDHIHYGPGSFCIWDLEHAATLSQTVIVRILLILGVNIPRWGLRLGSLCKPTQHPY